MTHHKERTSSPQREWRLMNLVPVALLSLLVSCSSIAIYNVQTSFAKGRNMSQEQIEKFAKYKTDTLEKIIHTLEKKGKCFSDNMKKAAGIGLTGFRTYYDRALAADSYQKNFTVEEKDQFHEIIEAVQRQFLREFDNGTLDEAWAHRFTNHEPYEELNKLRTWIMEEADHAPVPWTQGMENRLNVAAINKLVNTGLAKNPRDAIRMIARDDPGAKGVFKKAQSEIYLQDNAEWFVGKFVGKPAPPLSIPWWVNEIISKNIHSLRRNVCTETDKELYQKLVWTVLEYQAADKSTTEFLTDNKSLIKSLETNPTLAKLKNGLLKTLEK